MIQSLLIGVLHLEQFSAERASLLLSSFQLCLALLILLFPFCQDLELNRFIKCLVNYMCVFLVTKFVWIASLAIYLIKVPLLLVKVGSQRIGSLHINHEVLHLTLQPLLGLLQRGALGVHSLNGFLSILQALGKLFPIVKKNLLVLN